MHNDFRCTSCGKRFFFSAGTCGGCLTGVVVYDGAESRAANELYEQQQKARRAAEAAAKERAEQEAKARRDAEKKARARTPNPATAVGWNTPLAVITFIAVGIYLASRDLEGGQILIGAVIAAVLAGVFYKVVFAIVGVAMVGWILYLIVADDKPRRRASSAQTIVIEPAPSSGPAPAVSAPPPPPPVLHKAAQPPATNGSTNLSSIGIVDGDPAFATPSGRCIDFSADRMQCLLMGGEVAYLAGGGTMAYDGNLYVYHYKPLYPNTVSHLEVFMQDDSLIAVMRNGSPYYLGPGLAKELQRTLLAYDVKDALILQLPYQQGIGLIESKADALVRIEVPLHIYSGSVPAHYVVLQ